MDNSVRCSKCGSVDVDFHKSRRDGVDNSVINSLDGNLSQTDHAESVCIVYVDQPDGVRDQSQSYVART